MLPYLLFQLMLMAAALYPTVLTQQGSTLELAVDTPLTVACQMKATTTITFT